MRVNVTGSGYIGDEERVGCKTSPTQRRTETFKCTARGKEDHVWFGYGAGTFLPSSFTQRSLFLGHRNTWTQFTSRSPIFLPGFIVALEMIHRDLAGLSGASCLWQIFFPFF